MIHCCVRVFAVAVKQVHPLFFVCALFILHQCHVNPTLTCSVHGGVHAHACSCVFPPTLHVGRDPWWWIRAGTNLLVHLWNKNQGRRNRQRAPSHSHQASYGHNLTLYAFTVHTHTHTAHAHMHAHNLALPPVFSIFFSRQRAAQNRPDCRTNLRVTRRARHVWSHCVMPWMKGTCTKKMQLQPCPQL